MVRQRSRHWLFGRCAGFVNENKQFPRQQFAFVVDGLSTVAGSLMGTSPISTCAVEEVRKPCALQNVLHLASLSCADDAVQNSAFAPQNSASLNIAAEIMQGFPELSQSKPMRRYIESASGIREGGRTGLTALTVCFYFFVSLFFSPLLGASLPHYTRRTLLLLSIALL